MESNDYLNWVYLEAIKTAGDLGMSLDDAEQYAVDAVDRELDTEPYASALELA